MKRIITGLTSLFLLISICGSIYAIAENPTKEKVKPEIQHIYGEVTALDLEKNIITIKQEDGTEVTLKATTEKTQGMLKELKIGDKVKAVYTKTGEGLILLKVITPGKPEKVKPEIQHIYGEVTALDLEKNIITIKQEDGTEVTLKATTEKTQGMLKELKIGDKVKAVYTKTGEGLVIINLVKPEAKGKEKHKKK
ncbi:MAG: copper-binding protein [Candidatus Omnitrophica bacterium]|nr:copper-binding protein [Candidatus Omnitrophota bacterium]MCM8803603.1 copper-binding protein [Candidatus Omnitrophota bacterium]